MASRATIDGFIPLSNGRPVLAGEDNVRLSAFAMGYVALIIAV